MHRPLRTPLLDLTKDRSGAPKQVDVSTLGSAHAPCFTYCQT